MGAIRKREGERERGRGKYRENEEYVDVLSPECRTKS
jgi:hypothetical protein